jgi:hypothetical protein
MGIFRGQAPVVPGPAGATPAPGPVDNCVACQAGDDNGVLRVREGELVLCLDPLACTDRYRGGVSPETYAAGLRGDLLAVAP